MKYKLITGIYPEEIGLRVQELWARGYRFQGGVAIGSSDSVMGVVTTYAQAMVKYEASDKQSQVFD